MTHPTDDEIMELAGAWFHTGENQKRDDGYYYRSLGTPSNVRGSDLIEFARALLAEQARTEPTQEFESAQGRALASAWAEGWAQCRDAEYVGEEAESEAFNQSHTLAQCLYADQTRFQGGLSNDQLRRAWSAKLPNVIPTDEQLTAFALGIEAAAQPLKAEQAKDAAEDAPSDQVIELAGALEVRRILEAIKEVANLRPANDKIIFDAAWQLCCEEIFYRATGCRWHMDEDAERFSRAARAAEGKA